MFAQSTRIIAAQAQRAAVRSLATKASHAPPKKVHGTIGRYASAVYTSASKASLLEKVETELLAFRESLTKQPVFAAFLANPTVARADKYNQLGDMLDESKFCHISRNLLLTLSANGRIGEASKVIATFEELMQASRGAVKVVVISAEALKPKQLQAVEEGVKALVGKGKTVDISTEVDESILGGLQVMIGDSFLDMSVAARVSELSATLDAPMA